MEVRGIGIIKRRFHFRHWELPLEKRLDLVGYVKRLAGSRGGDRIGLDQEFYEV
jgi:serine kinase of HPr protein (carbohydrate metabolism regulator)